MGWDDASASLAGSEKLHWSNPAKMSGLVMMRLIPSTLVR
jgi:hypothetical protein